MDPMNVPTKFEVRSFTVPEIIGATSKLWAIPGYAVQGYSRSLILVPIESAYVTSY